MLRDGGERSTRFEIDQWFDFFFCQSIDNPLCTSNTEHEANNIYTKYVANITNFQDDISGLVADMVTQQQEMPIQLSINSCQPDGVNSYRTCCAGKKNYWKVPVPATGSIQQIHAWTDVGSGDVTLYYSATVNSDPANSVCAELHPRR